MGVSLKNVGSVSLARVLIVVAFVYPLIVIAQGGFDSPAVPSNASAQEQQPVEDEQVNLTRDVDLNSINKNLFKRLFVKRRKQHLEAVKDIEKINDYERQYKMIDLLSQKMFDVIESKKNILENYTDSDLANITFVNVTDFQNNVTDAISSVLENTAFFGDVVLNLPDITHRVLKTQPQWNNTMRWSFNFLNKTKDWVDNSTMAMIDLALQELNITEREPNYINPKRAVRAKVLNLTEKKKQKRKKGPMITRVEL